MVGMTFKWLARGGALIILTLGLANCTMLGLNYSSLDTQNKPAASPAIESDFDPQFVRATLETELYGPWPAGLQITAGDIRTIDAEYLGGRGVLQEIDFIVASGTETRTFPVVLAIPNIAADAPVPLIISQTFSSNCSAFPGSAVTAPSGTPCEGTEMGGMFGLLATQIFGTYIAEVPAERYLDAGIAYASFYGSSFVPDSNGPAQQTMATLNADTLPTGTLIAWASAFHAVAETLGVDPRIDAGATLALGHSRFGKAALIASAWSDQINGAIAHQSGFAGAASSRSSTGERLDRMAKSYPHWLRPGLYEDLEQGAELTLDQHFLLALSAPKPIFLGNGRRDVWSDPNSTFRMALGADSVYKAKGAQGLTSDKMKAFDPAADISYWLRVGGHSVVSEDIDAFIAFTLAHFRTADAD